MAKVIKIFRERYHDMKRYNIGDEYPEDDAARVKFLVKMGYLAEPEKPRRRKKAVSDNGDSDA